MPERMSHPGRELLLAMPLHAVTEVYGTEGLSRLFGFEIGAFDDDERGVLLRAERLAAELHAEDLRVREPYVNHLLRVAIRVIRYRVRDVDVVTAALLHDSVEDHPGELAALAGDAERGRGGKAAALGVVARDFNRRVAEIIDAVTNPDYTPDRDKHEQYREHVTESLEVNPWARVIKLSDFTDNGVGITYVTDLAMSRRLATKYAPLVEPLREFALRADTPLDDAAKQHISEQLDLAVQRFQAILNPSDEPGRG